MTVSETAERLGKSIATVTRWCQSGKLTAIPRAFGFKTTYFITPQALEFFQNRQKLLQFEENSQKRKILPHASYIKGWIQAMSRGTLTGKVYSQTTADGYIYYIERFFKAQKSLSVKTLESELAKVPSDMFATRENIWRSALCFSKYLVKEGILEKGFQASIKPLKPKRHLPPKRFTVEEENVLKLIEVASNPLDRLLVILLAHTGLRASEATSLRIDDINLIKGFLNVRKGKGGKSRKVGLSKSLLNALEEYLKGSQHGQIHLFLNRDGKPMAVSGLYQRLERVGRQAKVKVSPHALRRAFVTINGNKGRPLQMLQMACGHADIQTTRHYCLTTEEEVINAMKDWD
ncbi:MAG: tyrosine-type recombinase/integrase [Vampirovibrionales bacterium]|nr:tyrosine-type recombinase/integrase [Vampirovibrionales bacterium]